MTIYPSAQSMHCLHALTQGVEFSTFPDGEMAVRVLTPRTVTGWQYVRIPAEALDELVDRGWVILVGDDELEVSEAGVYHVRVWLDRQTKADRKARRVRR